MPDTLLRATGVTKTFGGIRALRDVDLEITRGEVHGLIGPNGSGKSTLMKIIAGFYRPDEGELTVNGEIMHRGVAASRAQGITIVPQEITLVPLLTVEENIILGAEPEGIRGFRSRAKSREAASRILAEVGCTAEPDELAQDIVPSQRRLIMLAAALHRGAQLLILDEPTAGLAADEAENVAAAIARLKSSGRTVLLVSHRLDELITLSDRITVIREGEIVGAFSERRASREELIRLIAPTHELVSDAEVAAVDTAASAGEGPLLTLEHGSSGYLRDLSLSVRRGECVGIVGGVGSGVREAAEILSGALKLTGGRLSAGSKPAAIHSVSDALAAGLLFISGERFRFVMHDRSVGFHICLPSLEDRARWGLVSAHRESVAAQGALDSVGVTAEVSQPLSSLSGGNQQRALFARAALGQTDVISVYEPSVGVDVHGRELLRQHIRNLRKDHAVVVLSSDPDELAGLCTSVVCLRNGEVSIVLEREQVTVPLMLDAIS